MVVSRQVFLPAEGTVGPSVAAVEPGAPGRVAGDASIPVATEVAYVVLLWCCLSCLCLSCWAGSASDGVVLVNARPDVVGLDWVGFSGMLKCVLKYKYWNTLDSLTMSDWTNHQSLGTNYFPCFAPVWQF